MEWMTSVHADAEYENMIDVCRASATDKYNRDATNTIRFKWRVSVSDLNFSSLTKWMWWRNARIKIIALMCLVRAACNITSLPIYSVAIVKTQTWGDTHRMSEKWPIYYQQQKAKSYIFETDHNAAGTEKWNDDEFSRFSSTSFAARAQPVSPVQS